jgi:hypothetical protein
MPIKVKSVCSPRLGGECRIVGFVSLNLTGTPEWLVSERMLLSAPKVKQT